MKIIRVIQEEVKEKADKEINDPEEAVRIYEEELIDIIKSISRLNVSIYFSQRPTFIDNTES